MFLDFLKEKDTTRNSPGAHYLPSRGYARFILPYHSERTWMSWTIFLVALRHKTDPTAS